MKKKWLIYSLICLFLLGGASYFVFVYPEARQKAMLAQKKKAEWIRLRQALANRTNYFAGSAGIVVKDLKTGWQFSFNQGQEFPSASLVKIPIMAAVFKAAAEGRVNLEQPLVLTGAQKTPGSGKIRYMPEGSSFTVRQLVERMVIDSDNTASNMLIGLMGIDNLNVSFKELGLKNTNLSRKMMDFTYREEGIENYTTAQDIAFILEKIYENRLINDDISTACLDILKRQKIKDRIPALLPPSAVVAHKTGLERGVCHDAGIIYSPDGNFLICVLTQGAKSSRAAKTFISHLALNVYKCYVK